MRLQYLLGYAERLGQGERVRLQDAENRLHGVGEVLDLTGRHPSAGQQIPTVCGDPAQREQGVQGTQQVRREAGGHPSGGGH